MISGVDVSHHQDPDRIDWDRFFQSGVRFAFMRATYGVKEDATFLRHVENARLAGILTGAYHFLRFKKSQPAAAQAEAFLEALEPLAPHANTYLPPMLDLEDNQFDDQIKTAQDRRNFVAMANSWLQIVEQRLGRLAGIYTRASFFDDDLDSPAGFGVRPLWVAHYTSKPSPNIPSAWARHHFWQYTESGQLPGYDKKLDLNRFEGSQADLDALARGESFTDGPAPLPGLEPRHDPLGLQGAPVMRVASKGLNLRSARKVSDETFVVGLPLGHRVEVLEPGLADAGGRRWARVRTFVGNAQEHGFVVESYLRGRERDSVEALVDAAVAEWKRFKRGAGKETMPPYSGYVGEMWRALDAASTTDGTNTDRFWSAAAISFFVKNAGPAYDGFKRSARHSTYIHDAIAKREAGDAAPFWGFRLREQPVAVGDIVCIDRTDAGIDYDHALHNSKFSSHTDVVVGIYHSRAVTLGGNVSNSVSTSTYELDGEGKLVPGGNLFALMKNRTE